ncbi:MAG TPA: hypothetical protein VLN59_01525 [Burkholderiales bacterium]|nr:hypothetical protein [Burkholderiales bacterium]
MRIDPASRLAALTKLDNIVLMIAPTDLRSAEATLSGAMPWWTARLYGRMKQEFAQFPESGSSMP